MADWHVAQGVSHAEAPGVFCTVDTPDDDQDARYLPDLNAAMHFLVGNKLRFGDRIIMDGTPSEGEGRNLKVDKVIRGTRIHFDVGGVGLPDGVTEIFDPEDLILWLTNVLQPGDCVAYLED
jgi:hypothetical protein